MCARANITTRSKEVKRALARSEVYLFLARGFSYPRVPLKPYFQRAQQAADSLGTDSLLRVLKLPQDEALESQYIRVFGHTMPTSYPPYEMEYDNTYEFLQESSFSELASFYRTFGAQPTSGERLDHVATQLEFMYFLAYREAYAWQSGNQEGAARCRDGQRLFLEQHLGRWALLFFQLLEEDEEGFYAALAGGAAKWLATETEALDSHPVLLGKEVLALKQRNTADHSALEADSAALCDVEEEQ